MNDDGLGASSACCMTRPGSERGPGPFQTSVLARASAPPASAGVWIGSDPRPPPACYEDGGRSLRALNPDTGGLLGDAGPPATARESSWDGRRRLVCNRPFKWVYSSRATAAARARWSKR